MNVWQVSGGCIGRLLVTLGGMYTLVTSDVSGHCRFFILTHSAPAYNVDTGNTATVKCEYQSVSPSALRVEAGFYQCLSGGVGIPQILLYTEKHYCYKAMVFERLGFSLDYLFKLCGSKFSLKTVLLLANQLLHRFEHIHSRGLVHGDVAPGDIVMGLGRNMNIVYVMGFGPATTFYTLETVGTSPPNRTVSSTLRYTSLRAHMGIGKCSILVSYRSRY